MSPESGHSKKEKAPELLARVTFSRHEETNYTGVGRDITDEGIVRAQEKGRAIAQEKGTPVFYGHSPRERAHGTATSIAEGAREANDDTTNERWMKFPGLRSTDFRDEAFREQLIEKLGNSQEAWADAHYNEPEFYNNPDKIETNEEKRVRLYREIERVIAFLEKRGLKGEVPHLVLVSHYEIITLLLDDVFGIQTLGSTAAPTFGEHVDLDIYKPLSNGDTPIRVHYNDHEQQVIFNRNLHRMVAP